MALKPESDSGSGPMNPSISELVSGLRDSFLSRDFDRVEEALVAREARLKAELEEKKREIESLKERMTFETLERIRMQFELKRVREERCDVKKKNGGFGSGNGKCKVVVVAEVESRKFGFLGEKERRGSVMKMEKEKEKEMKSCEEGRKVVENGTNGSLKLKINENSLGASGENFEKRIVIDIEDSDEDECGSQGPLDKKETTSCAIRDNDHQNSSGAFENKLLSGLPETIGNLKRKFASLRELGTNMNGLDSDTSSSSSSSCSSSDLFDMNNLPISDKKTRTDATSSGLNFSLR